MLEFSAILFYLHPRGMVYCLCLFGLESFFQISHILCPDALPSILQDIPSLNLGPTDACGIGTAAFITDCRKQDKIAWVSLAFEHLTQYQANDLLGRTEKVLEGPLTVKRIEKLRERLGVEVIHYRSDGSLFINQFEVFLLGEHLILFKQLQIKSLEHRSQSPMDSWTVIEVGIWLKRRHFSATVIYCFFDHNVDGNNALGLTHSGLTEIGITSLFDQDRIINFLAIESAFRAQYNSF